MDSNKKSNKISEIVKLHQILKKWRKLANSSKTGTTKEDINTNNIKPIQFLKKSLSFSEKPGLKEAAVPKGSLAVCVGEEMRRFVIPMEYLGHGAFAVLLKEAEEEFGFQQAGVLRIPCGVSQFEEILKVVEGKEAQFNDHEYVLGNGSNGGYGCCSSESQITRSHHPQNPICR